MKNLKIGLLALAMVFVTGCSKEDEEKVKVKEKTLPLEQVIDGAFTITTIKSEKKENVLAGTEAKETPKGTISFSKDGENYNLIVKGFDYKEYGADPLDLTFPTTLVETATKGIFDVQFVEKELEGLVKLPFEITLSVTDGGATLLGIPKEDVVIKVAGKYLTYVTSIIPLETKLVKHMEEVYNGVVYENKEDKNVSLELALNVSVEVGHTLGEDKDEGRKLLLAGIENEKTRALIDVIVNYGGGEFVAKTKKDALLKAMDELLDKKIEDFFVQIKATK